MKRIEKRREKLRRKGDGKGKENWEEKLKMIGRKMKLRDRKERKRYVVIKGLKEGS